MSLPFVDGDGKIHARVKRDGTTLIDVVMRLGEPLPAPASSPGQPLFNVKLIPSVQKDARPDVKQLISTTLRDATVAKLRMGEGALVLGSIASSPLSKIPVRKILRCMYVDSSFVMDDGKVVHDYPADGSVKR